MNPKREKRKQKTYEMLMLIIIVIIHCTYMMNWCYHILMLNSHEKGKITHISPINNVLMMKWQMEKSFLFHSILFPIRERIGSYPRPKWTYRMYSFNLILLFHFFLQLNPFISSGKLWFDSMPALTTKSKLFTLLTKIKA